MRHLLLAIPLILAPACLAPDGSLDVPATTQELDLTALDLMDLAAVADGQNKPGTAQALRDAAGALQAASAALSAGTGTGDAWGLLDAALAQLEAVAAANEDSDLLIGVTAAKMIVRRAQAHLAEPPG